MGRLLVVGIGPLPFENTALPLGLGLRTWHFAGQLHGAGHTVRLLTLRPWERIGQHTHPLQHTSGLEEFRLQFDGHPDTGPRITALCDAFQPDAIFAVGVPAAAAAAHLAPATPFWADVFGDYLAEAQLKAVRVRDDAVLDDWQRHLALVLARADVLSAVSQRQAWALVGQLGSAGRLRKDAVGYDFVHTIPCAVPDGDLRPPRRDDGAALDRRVTALWSGSFNTWCDVATFAAGGEAALLSTPELRIEVTGGAVQGHDEFTFEEFLSFIAASSVRDRFVVHGWVDGEALEPIYARADMGVSLGRWSYERALGSENRATSFLVRGIPVIISRGSELAEEIGRVGAGLIVPPEDARAFFEALRALAISRERRFAMAEAAYAFGQRLTYSATARPFLEWAEDPRVAPGRSIS